MGKHKPRGIYSPANDQAGDYVVVTDAEKVGVTGKKAEQKVYYRHSMYPGGLKVERYQERMEKKPEEVSMREGPRRKGEADPVPVTMLAADHPLSRLRDAP